MYRLFSDYRDQDKNPYSIFLMYSYPFCGRAYIFFAKIMLFREKLMESQKKNKREKTAKIQALLPVTCDDCDK